ncbi:hypothetical protein SAMN05421858_0457 [Haladaptatus litoreus]|uniref:Uncharacterized protein n=1 Tax=Haladaptatus litoreus TaxID=553468 RepID=A0A1N6VRK0_9EURY|nr:hypothetical protein SAMN05421858_0457 [Haladaptatus litoreus]
MTASAHHVKIHISKVFTNHRGACADSPEALAAEGLSGFARGMTRTSAASGEKSIGEGVACGGCCGFIGVVTCQRHLSKQ